MAVRIMADFFSCYVRAKTYRRVFGLKRRAQSCLENRSLKNRFNDMGSGRDPTRIFRLVCGKFASFGFHRVEFFECTYMCFRGRAT